MKGGLLASLLVLMARPMHDAGVPRAAAASPKSPLPPHLHAHLQNWGHGLAGFLALSCHESMLRLQHCNVILQDHQHCTFWAAAGGGGLDRM